MLSSLQAGNTKLWQAILSSPSGRYGRAALTGKQVQQWVCAEHKIRNFKLEGQWCFETTTEAALFVWLPVERMKYFTALLLPPHAKYWMVKIMQILANTKILHCHAIFYIKCWADELTSYFFFYRLEVIFLHHVCKTNQFIFFHFCSIYSYLVVVSL